MGTQITEANQVSASTESRPWRRTSAALVAGALAIAGCSKAEAPPVNGRTTPRAEAESPSASSDETDRFTEVFARGGLVDCAIDPETYSVRPGDNLYNIVDDDYRGQVAEILMQYHFAAIKDINLEKGRLTNVDKLQVGQKILTLSDCSLTFTDIERSFMVKHYQTPPHAEHINTDTGEIIYCYPPKGCN